MSRKEWNHAKLINFDKDGNLQLIDTWSDRSTVLPKPEGLNVKRNIREFLDRVNNTYVQHSKTLRYGQIVMNELYNYDLIAYNTNGGTIYDVYNNETNISNLLQSLERKWKEDEETRPTTFLILYKHRSWEREIFHVSAKLLDNSTNKEVEQWVLDNMQCPKDVYMCILRR